MENSFREVPPKLHPLCTAILLHLFLLVPKPCVNKSWLHCLTASSCSRDHWEGFMVGTIHLLICKKKNRVSSEKLVAVILILTMHSPLTWLLHLWLRGSRQCCGRISTWNWCPQLWSPSHDMGTLDRAVPRGLYIRNSHLVTESRGAERWTNIRARRRLHRHQGWLNQWRHGGSENNVGPLWLEWHVFYPNSS